MQHDKLEHDKLIEHYRNEATALFELLLHKRLSVLKYFKENPYDDQQLAYLAYGISVYIPIEILISSLVAVFKNEYSVNNLSLMNTLILAILKADTEGKLNNEDTLSNVVEALKSVHSLTLIRRTTDSVIHVPTYFRRDVLDPIADHILNIANGKINHYYYTSFVEDVYNDLTAMAVYNLVSLNFSDLVNGKYNADAHFFNGLNMLIASNILNFNAVDKRKRVFDFFYTILECALNEHNFAVAFPIFNALNSEHCVIRLKENIEHSLPKKHNAPLEAKYQELTQKNYAVVREQTLTHKNAIYYLPIYLSDIDHIQKNGHKIKFSVDNTEEQLASLSQIIHLGAVLSIIHKKNLIYAKQKRFKNYCYKTDIRDTIINFSKNYEAQKTSLEKKSMIIKPPIININKNNQLNDTILIMLEEVANAKTKLVVNKIKKNTASVQLEDKYAADAIIKQLLEEKLTLPYTEDNLRLSINIINLLSEIAKNRNFTFATTELLRKFSHSYESQGIKLKPLETIAAIKTLTRSTSHKDLKELQVTRSQPSIQVTPPVETPRKLQRGTSLLVGMHKIGAPATPILPYYKLQMGDIPRKNSAPSSHVDFAETILEELITPPELDLKPPTSRVNKQVP